MNKIFFKLFNPANIKRVKQIIKSLSSGTKAMVTFLSTLIAIFTFFSTKNDWICENYPQFSLNCKENKEIIYGPDTLVSITISPRIDTTNTPPSPPQKSPTHVNIYPFERSFANNSGTTELAIFIEGEKQDLEMELAEYFAAAGFQPSNGFFNRQLLKKSEINRLQNGEASLLREWNLNKHIDGYFIGTARYTEKPNPVRDTWVTANLTLRGSLVTINSGSVKRITIKEDGTGMTSEEAYQNILEGVREQLQANAVSL